MPLAYTPFLDPLPIDRYWLIFLPVLVAATALTYRLLQARHLRDVPRQTLRLLTQVMVLMGIGVGLLWLITWVW